MKKQIREIIEWSLKEMDLYSEDAVDLVYKTGNAETGYRHLKHLYIILAGKVRTSIFKLTIHSLLGASVLLIKLLLIVA